ncbi:uncharacterized protein LOC124381475 isoform X2 [Silurus meridionalis]|uniref:uncharacterized protein LOC124381475 isoform X2 n=1 Tax=Silurus meridionalis TaxID=175797 RepID=UPI001EEB45BE|nr:uncharacterized protein LOC124381475 isoform X2 [Silurus meridionalis]
MVNVEDLGDVQGQQNVLLAPVSSYFSMTSSQSMHHRMNEGNTRAKLEAPSPAPTCMSFKSEQSKDQFIGFNGRPKLEAPSPAPTCISFKSEQSKDQFIGFQRSVLHSSLLMDDHLKCPECKDVLKVPVSIPCGHSFCKSCIQSYWEKSPHKGIYSCPQCKKKFKPCPLLSLNLALNNVIKQAGFSPALPAQNYAGPGDVGCDICTGKRKRAVKSCLTCSIVYCENHVRQHYTVEALQRHTLIDITEDLESRICQLHHRALEVFCKTDQAFICLVCVMEGHKNHDTLMAKREAQDVKASLSDLHEDKIRSSNERTNDQMQQNYVELTAKVKRIETELSHLSKQIYKGFEDVSEFVEVAALGRKVELGWLYNFRSDYLSSDVFWDEDKVSSMKVSIPRLHKDVRILDKDSLQNRLAALDLSVSLRASVVSGLVKMTGASAFINHLIQSELQDRITVHYRTSTRLDMISHDLLHDGFPLSVTDSTTATHVVVAVLYGSQAFFVFDNKKETIPENTDLKDIIKKVTSSSQTHLISKFTEKEKKAAMSCVCAAFIDGDVLQSTLDFDTAVNLYNSLETSGEVPLKFWLYPLNSLDQTSSYVVRNVNEDELLNAENVLEHLGRQINFCHNTMSIFNSHDVFTQFSHVKDTLCEFSSLLQQYQSIFQKRLAFCIKTIREGKEVLEEFLKTNANSPFSVNKTHQWLLNKSTEIRALIQCKSANVTIVKGQNDLQHIVQDCQADKVLCFILTSLEGEDPFLSALTNHILALNTVIKTETQQAVMVSETDQKILSDLESFLLNKEADENTQKTMFVAASVPDPCFLGSAIQLYQSDRLLREKQHLELKVELPKIIAVQQTYVTIKLQTAEHYRVECRSVRKDKSHDVKWRVVVCSEENCVVKGLVPGTRYQVRCALMTSDGMSDYSEIAEFQTVSKHRPGPPEVLKPNKESLYIAWQRAESDEDSPVLCYKVEYLDAGLEGWQSIQTDGPVCECTINLLHSNCYRFRVSAVYGNGDISIPSEETEIPVHVWKINLSKRKASLLVELLKLQTVMKPVEITGWTDAKIEIQSLFQCLRYTTQLSLSSDVMVKMVHNMGTIETGGPVTLRELSIVERSTQLSNEAASRIQSSLASLLQLWTIECLDLTEYKMEVQSYTVLINQQAPLFIRFSEETLKKLVVMVYEAQDEELTRCFLQKVDGDLISCSLAWEVIHYFLQYRTVTVDFRRSTIKEENICDILPLLNRLKLRRLNSNFFLSVMKEICKTGSVQFVSSLLGLAENCIKLDNRMLNSVDCAALRFTLEHSTSISLNLLCASIPEGELESTVPLLSHVSHLRVDRLLLVRLLHCCSAPDLQKETSNLLTALHHKLDFSCQNSLDLTADTTTYILCAEDCKVICMAIQEAHEKICLILHDCEIEEAGVKQLFPILDTVTLQCSDALLHKLLPSVPVEAELKSKAQRDGMDLGPGAVDN